MGKGIKETKEFMTFVMLLVGAIVKTFEDKEVTPGDLAFFGQPILASAEGIMGLTEIPAEITNMSEAQKTELNAHIAAKFDIPDDKIEKVVEEALKVAVSLAPMILTTMDAMKKKA